MSDRPETGVMQFGDDWPGLFIRGDNARAYGMALDDVLQTYASPNMISLMEVKGLLRLLEGVDNRIGPSDRNVPLQKLKPFNDCKNPPEEEGPR